MGNSYYEKFADGKVKCIDEDIPFDIPARWEWTRLGAVASIIGGYAFPSQTLKGDTGIRVVRISDINENGFVNTRLVRYCGPKISNTYRIEAEDILMAMTGGTVGKSLYVRFLPEEMLLNQRVAIIRNEWFLSEYLNLVIKAPHIMAVINDRKNSTNDNISMEDIYNFLVPVPSVDCQRKIVDSFYTLLPSIERYGEAQNRLDKLNAEVKGLIRKSILQEAIQGKLVPQVLTDEPAIALLESIRKEKQKLLKEGKLKRKDLVDSVIYKGEHNKYYETIDGKLLDINEEIPFDIPDSWLWVRLQQVCIYIHRGKSPKYSEVKKYPVIAQKCNQWDGFHIEKAQFISPESISSYADEHFLQDKDLLWNSTGLGTLGRIGLYPESLNPYGFAVADSHVTVIRTLPMMVRPEYLLMYFSSQTVQGVIEDKASGSTKQKELSTETVKSYLVPIPPLAEQDRILDKYKLIVASLS